MTDIAAIVAALRPGDVDTTFLRICNLEDPRPVIEALTKLTPAQKLFLYQGEGYKSRPTDNDVIESHIEQIFTRSLIGRADRYSRMRHAMYTSVSRGTAEEEVRHYARTLLYNPTLDDERLSFDVVNIGFRGLAARLSSLIPQFPALRGFLPVGDSQRLGDEAATKLSCLLVRSARGRGSNGVIFRRPDVRALGKKPELSFRVLRRGAVRVTTRS